MKHRPQIYAARRRLGVWCVCACGWRSRSWTTPSGAHLEFGEHLLAVRPNDAMMVANHQPVIGVDQPTAPVEESTP